MKINDVEKLLGITKANIRFYEKEGLLTPGRSENGYREYSDADIARLKQIVVLRKLGIPVQQIADILDGALPLQEAVDANIAALNEEIGKLNGALALCRQLKAEDSEVLDTERYWEIIHDQEQLGFQFQSLASDYINFLAPVLSWAYWIPEDAWHSPLRIVKYLLGWSVLFAFLGSFTGGSFGESLGSGFYGAIRGIVIWGIILLPVYFIGRKKPKLAETLKVLIPVGMLILVFGYFCWVLISGYNG